MLNHCARGASRAARRVRSETEIARNPVSVSSVAVELARNFFDDFHGKHVLVLGAGKMSDLAARALRAHGATLTVTNRTRARAEELAARVGGDVHDWSDLPGALAKADIVIASTGAQQPVLTRDLMAGVQRARRGRTIFLIDIAMPRDVDPSVTKLDGVYVADIDDLQKESARHLEGRQTEAAQGEAIVDAEVTRFLQSWGGQQLGPLVTAMRTHVIGLAHAEVDKLLAGLSHVPEKDRKAIQASFDGFAKKVLHLPQMALKKDAGEALSLVDAARKLFDLQVEEPLPERAGRRGRRQARGRRGQRGRRRERPRQARYRHARQRALSAGEERRTSVARSPRPTPASSSRAHPRHRGRPRVQTGAVAIELGGKSVWVQEIEDALTEAAIDLAVLASRTCRPRSRLAWRSSPSPSARIRATPS